MDEGQQELPRLSFSTLLNLPEGLGIDAHGYSLITDDPSSRQLHGLHSPSHGALMQDDFTLFPTNHASDAQDAGNLNKSSARIELESPAQIEDHQTHTSSHDLQRAPAPLFGEPSIVNLQDGNYDNAGDPYHNNLKPWPTLQLGFSENTLTFAESTNTGDHALSERLEAPLFHAPFLRFNSKNDSQTYSYLRPSFPVSWPGTQSPGPHEGTHTDLISAPLSTHIEDVHSTNDGNEDYEKEEDEEDEGEEQDDFPVIFTRDGIILGSPIHDSADTNLRSASPSLSHRAPSASSNDFAYTPSLDPVQRPSRPGPPHYSTPPVQAAAPTKDTQPASRSGTVPFTRSKLTHTLDRKPRNELRQHPYRRITPRLSNTIGKTHASRPHTYTWTLTYPPSPTSEPTSLLESASKQTYTVSLALEHSTNDFSVRIHTATTTSNSNSISLSSVNSETVCLSRGQVAAVTQLAPEIRRVLAGLSFERDAGQGLTIPALVVSRLS